MERCRLCAKEKNGSEFISLFTSNLLQKIRAVLPIVVIEGDPLPQEICSVCEGKLNAFHAFYEDTKRADFLLRSQLPLGIPAAPVSDPFLHFHDVHAFLTAAYSKFVSITDKPKVQDKFVIRTIDQTTLYSCKTCKRTYLSGVSAFRHVCDQQTKSKSFVNLSSSTSIVNIPSLDTAKIETEKSVKGSNSGPSDQEGKSKRAKINPSSQTCIESSLVETKSNISTSDQTVTGSSSVPCALNNTNTPKLNLECAVSLSRSCIQNTDSLVTQSTDLNGNTDLPEVIWKSSNGRKEDFYFKRKKESDKQKRRKRSKSHDTTERDKEHVCEVCGKVFQYAAELVLHSGIHNLHLTPQANTIHEELPTGKKHMYVCHFCQLSFTRKTTLLSHERDHLEKSFQDSWSDDAMGT